MDRQKADRQDEVLRCAESKRRESMQKARHRHPDKHTERGQQAAMVRLGIARYLLVVIAILANGPFAQLVASHSPQPVASTFDVQHIGVIEDVPRLTKERAHGGTVLNHYTIATIRVSFDRALYVRRDKVKGVGHIESHANSSLVRRRIDLVKPGTLEGLTRVRCDGHIIESAPTLEDPVDNNGLPNYLFALTSVRSPKEWPSRALQTIIDTVLESSKSMSNQYTAILILPPRKHLLAKGLGTGKTQDDYDYDSGLYGEDEAWSMHPLQFWDPAELSMCKLEFLHPMMQVSRGESSVTVSGPSGELFLSSKYDTVQHAEEIEPHAIDAPRGLPLEQVRPPRLSYESAYRIAAASSSRRQDELRDDFASQLDAILDFATTYDKTVELEDDQEEDDDILEGSPNQSSNDHDKDLVARDILSFRSMLFSSSTAEDDKEEDNNGSEEDKDIIENWDKHTSNMAYSFSHSGMVVSLLEDTVLARGVL